MTGVAPLVPLLLGWAALTLGCTGEEPRAEAVDPRPLVADPSCPPEAFLEELHASAFHFQHGPVDVGRAHLERARALAPAHADPVSARILAQLGEISRRIETDPDGAQAETENVRVAFGDWPCLTESMHRRFHEPLPPIPLLGVP